MGKKKVITIEPTLVRDMGSENTNLRVAAYCRVSTDSQEQENSYDNQLKYYTNFINSHPSWINAGIFADKGISGKFKNKRPNFLKMIASCEAKQIDQIITKSISRFGRNTQETVEIVRKLRDLNIGVLFEKENLFSLDSRTDFILMILSSIAEEESRDLSTNVKWTFAKQASQGIIMSPHAYFGYTAKGKDLVINPKNAKIVRLIYDTFEQRKRVSAVAKYLEQQGILSPHGNIKWHYSTVRIILTNEAYIGDIILQKTFTNDFLSKRKKNNGERKKWYVKNHHPAIITREQFARVQQLHADNKETNKRTKTFTKFPFSCLLVCANCGRHYMHAAYVIGEKKIPYWVCLSVKHYKKVGCTSPVIKEYILNRAYLSISPDNSLSTFRDEVEKIVIDKMLATFYFYTGEVVKLDLAKLKE